MWNRLNWEKLQRPSSASIVLSTCQRECFFFPMLSLSTPKRLHNQQNQGKIQDLDCTILSSSSEKLKREKGMENNHGKKTMDATRGAKKHGLSSVLDRWHNDEMYNNSQVATVWTEAYCNYFGLPPHD